MIKRNSQTIIKKISVGVVFSVFIFLNISFTQIALAQTDPQKDPRQYVALTTIPGFTIGCKPSADGSTTACPSINPVDKIVNIYGVAIGIAAILAVVRIIIAGLKYATTEAIDGKSDAKDTWQGAFYGLGLLLVSFLLLRTINIDLVNVNLHLGTPFVDNTEGARVASRLLTSAARKIEENAEKITTAISTQRAVIETAEQNLEAAKTSGDPEKIAVAQNTLNTAQATAVTVAKSVIKDTNSLVDSSITAAESFIPTGVEKSLKGEFSTKVNQIDTALDNAIATLEKQKSAATTDTEKRVIDIAIKNVADKKIMTDVGLDAAWRTSSNIKYASTQTDSLAAFQQSLINQRNSTLARVSDKNSVDAINFQRNMNTLILKIGNVINSPTK
ncbi:MAG: hypothetical protein RLZZ67_48 [Candidatus Parcubacteria bacterium]|jgi:hypothetical protein